MRDTTKLYLLAGFFWAVVAKFPFESWEYWVGGIMLGLMFGMQKRFILQEIREKKLKAYEQLMESLGDLEDKQGGVYEFDGEELKELSDFENDEKLFEPIEEKLAQDEEYYEEENLLVYVNDELVDSKIFTDKRMMRGYGKDENVMTFRTVAEHKEKVEVDNKITIKTKEDKILFEGKIVSYIQIKEMIIVEATNVPNEN